jgi:FRG domain
LQEQSSGEVIVEFDEVEGRLVGNVTVYPGDVTLPTSFVWATMDRNLQAWDQRLPVFYIDWSSSEPVVWQQIARMYPGVAAWPEYADTKWRLSNDTLYVSWVTDKGSFGLAVLTQGSPNAPSVRVPLKVANWLEFKEYATTLEPHRYVFRGHSDNKWRLRTYFHRTGRADLRRFVSIDIPSLHRLLSEMTSHFFNLSNPIENGAFYGLAQHHGYPTPLLDWTESPFVAAYFAYRTLSKEKRTSDHKVRIVMLDSKSWRTLPQLSQITPARRHLSMFTPLGINNSRLVPQQALLTISNVDDIEGYIAEIEAQRNITVLNVIDLPGLNDSR